VANRRAHSHPLVATHGGCEAGLPEELSSFVGSGAQIAAVVALLSGARLVTVTGGGGIGKTRLALQVARAIEHDFDQCSWIALSSVESSERIGELIGGSLRGDARTHQLLILDNCEHLISACADVVLRLLNTCPGVRVLATSREPLGVPGEVVYRVEPLMCGEAAQLFLERAYARDSRVRFDDQECASVARLCRTLNGMPLAIELAAARTSSMTVAALADRVEEDVLGVLATGPRAVAPRQQGLRASLDWSYVLLPAPEQRLLGALAVLADDFTVEDAIAVAEEIGEHDVPLLLDRLVCQSMVEARVDGARMRFSLLAPVRAFALERLHAVDGKKVKPTAAAHDGSAKPRRWRPRGLSERERDVVVLIASGRSNRQIADELVITKKTAEAHVSHILTKLGLCSRVQIATWSLQHGLVHGEDEVASDADARAA
jgi:predicted ATPase